MRKVYDYLNPLAYLGVRKYSIRFPILASLLLILVSEYYCYEIAHNPLAVGSYIIFAHAALIIYFSFRNAIKGGLTVTFFAVVYYLYIILTRNYSGDQLQSGLITTLLLGLLFAFIAISIGYLKETIDVLIEREADEKRRLQTIIDQLPVGILITDLEGRILQANKQMEIFLGRDIKKDAVAGRDTIPNATFNGRPVRPPQWPIAHTLTTGRPVTKKEFFIEQEGGKGFYLQISSLMIRNKSGKAVAAASIFADVTEQKELSKRKDDFINMASHELKTPITSIKLYTDALYNNLKNTIDVRFLKSLKNINYQTEKLQELVFDLLDVSRIQTGKFRFDKAKLDLNELLADTVNEIQKTTDKHEIQFKKDRKLYVLADKFRIYQVITNLLTNAIKYSPEGGKIIVNLRKTGGSAVVEVKDNGIGISKNQQEKIFEKLYQVSDPKEKTFPGLGMGLYISREIIKRHKGKIWVESEKDKGSSFFFSLPIAK